MALSKNDQISAKIKTGKYRVRSLSAGKSEVWSKFGVVVDDEDNDLDYVSCKLCGSVLQYAGNVFQ